MRCVFIYISPFTYFHQRCLPYVVLQYNADSAPIVVDASAVCAVDEFVGDEDAPDEEEPADEDDDEDREALKKLDEEIIQQVRDPVERIYSSFMYCLLKPCHCRLGLPIGPGSFSWHVPRCT